MKGKLFCLITLVVAGFGISILGAHAKSVAAPPPAAIRISTQEPGVIPSGTSLTVRTDDIISTNRASLGTVYEATVADEVLDQDGRVLIPKESPVELRVYSFRFLGPGGAGLTELALGAETITVNGVSYPVETARPQRDGGLGAGEHTAKSVGKADGPVLTRGRRIDVPTGTLLELQTDDAIRLKGYKR